MAALLAELSGAPGTVSKAHSRVSNSMSAMVVMQTWASSGDDVVSDHSVSLVP